MNPLMSRLSRYFENLRFPWLMLLATVAFVVNLFIPDAVPFLDEIVLGLVAVILGRLKRKPRTRPTTAGTTDSTKAEHHG
jgi:hypothetical protein